MPPGYSAASSASEPFADVTGALACSGGANIPSYTLVDLDGDGRLDLVFTRQCANASVGAGAWWFFRSSGSGFATTPEVWSLPSGFAGTSPPFPDTAGTLLCTGGTDAPAFTLVDMNGDGKLDLLVTRVCNDESGVGTTVWWMYENTGTSFAASPKVLTLPAGFTGATPPFAGIYGSLSCTDANTPEFSLVYMNDDLYPDLVVTQSCNDTNVGSTSWQVYLGSATGFVSAPISWTLPSGYTSPTHVFGDIYGNLTCSAASSVPSYSLVDMNGDGLPDLLVTETCAGATVGASEWLVYLGTGSAFATTPTVMTLPSGYIGTSTLPAFAQPSGALDCTSGTNVPAFVLFDMNGDARPDLLITEQCNDAAVGTTQWLYAENTGKGFAAPSAIALPGGYAAASGSTTKPFAGPVGALSCSGGANEPRFTLAYVSYYEERPDILVTERCQDTTTGATRWLLYPSTCM